MLIKLTLPWVPEPFGAAAGRATGEAAEIPRVSQWTSVWKVWILLKSSSENCVPPSDEKDIIQKYSNYSSIFIPRFWSSPKKIPTAFLLSPKPFLGAEKLREDLWVTCEKSRYRNPRSLQDQIISNPGQNEEDFNPISVQTASKITLKCPSLTWKDSCDDCDLSCLGTFTKPTAAFLEGNTLDSQWASQIIQGNPSLQGNGDI